MKKLIALAAGASFLFVFSAVGAAKKEKTDKYEHWLKEEVKLLITQEEEKEFKKLRTDEEKDKFIEIFWAKRDPSSGTKENEFKEEWYQRLDYVNKTFTSGPRKGWRCDMGKVHMFFGPPSSTSATAGTKRDDPMGGSQIEASSETWIYQPMPDLGLLEAFRVTFREYQFGYDLDQQTPQSILRALEIFPQKVIFSADLKALPRYKFSFDENSFEGKLIKDFMTTGNEVSQIALAWMPIFSRAQNQSAYVSFLVQIDPQKLDKKKFKEVSIFGKMKGESEEEDFLSSVKTEKGTEGRFLALGGVPLKAGRYTLYLGISDKDKQIYSLLKSELDVVDFWNGELNTSSLILSPQVVTAEKSDSEAGFNPFLIGEYKATPRWGNVFKQSEYLNVLFQVYNAQLENGAVSLVIDYFVISPQVGYKLNPQEIKEKIEPERALAGGTQIPLEPLKPGKYTFRIKVTDKIANKSIEKSADFTVE